MLSPTTLTPLLELRVCQAECSLTVLEKEPLLAWYSHLSPVILSLLNSCLGKSYQWPCTTWYLLPFYPVFQVPAWHHCFSGAPQLFYHSPSFSAAEFPPCSTPSSVYCDFCFLQVFSYFHHQVFQGFVYMLAPPLDHELSIRSWLNWEFDYVKYLEWKACRVGVYKERNFNVCNVPLTTKMFNAPNKSTILLCSRFKSIGHLRNGREQSQWSQCQSFNFQTFDEPILSSSGKKQIQNHTTGSSCFYWGTQWLCLVCLGASCKQCDICGIKDESCTFLKQSLYSSPLNHLLNLSHRYFTFMFYILKRVWAGAVAQIGHLPCMRRT